MYNKDLADRAVLFFKHLKHTKGQWAGKPFDLMEWQENEIIRPLFGTINRDGTRQYKTCFVTTGKKNGKSELAAGVANYLMFADGEMGAEIYSAASDRHQASIVFNVAAQMIRMNPSLKGRSKIIDSQKRIVFYETNSIYEAISSEAYSKDGYSPHGIIFDEIHAQPNKELWDVLTMGTGAARRQQLIFVITTAGYNKNSICYELYDYAKKVKSGIIKDPEFLPVIYEVGMDEDWEDEKIWYKANPSMNKIIKIKELRKEYKKVKKIPSLQNSFRRKRLNQWTASEIRWLPMDKWIACKGDYNEGDLIGKTCCGALDLSSNIDISAKVLVFPPQNGIDKFRLLFKFYIPKDNIEDRIHRDRVPYDVWVRGGYLTATPGNVIDYGYIINDIKQDLEKFDFREIAYDRWGATKIVQDLQELGFDKPEENKYADRNLVQFGQGFVSMSAPSKEFEKLIYGCNLEHNDNKVMNWMIDNAVIREDPAGNIKPDKGKSTQRIDGVVAAVMGLARAQLVEVGNQKFEAILI